MTVSRFEEFLEAGDVVRAIMVAPFGYHSTVDDGVFRFRIQSGPKRGNVGQSSTLLEAVRLAYRAAPSDRGTRA